MENPPIEKNICNTIREAKNGSKRFETEAGTELTMSILAWIKKIPMGIRRKIIQIAAFGFMNMHLGNLGVGKIYTGKWKNFCAPGLNCYSCPAAAFSCPIGAMQSIAKSPKTSFSLYAVGIILAFGVVLGRAVCGFLCPFGLLQDLLGLIPLPKFRLKKIFRYLKYVVLVVFVLLLPAVVTNVVGMGKPWFCEYICPAGTLEGGLFLVLGNPALRGTIGWVFWLKIGILAAIVILCLFCTRFFCKTLCPLGAIYGLLNKISLYHLQLDKNKCVDCGKCSSVCKMDVDPSKEVRSTECILCGKCTASCPAHALKMSWKIKEKEPDMEKQV